jgi:hypothetical protein
VQTLSFAQSDAVTRTLRTLSLTIATEGQHTLLARATDWAGATQTTVYPVVFTLDRQAPALTIDASALTLDDTWQSGSGILRFNGSAGDSVGLAAVQIREGEHAFADASFGNGAWHTALLVQDPEGRTLNIVVRAIDRAGRITQITQSIATNLSAADAADTTIASGPANPSALTSASFVFSGSASAVTFECQLDGGAYQPCASPQQYSDLSKGSHTFSVRAIDSRGFVDLTPASLSWTVSASQPDATISSGPSDPSTSRSASFAFSGDATAVRFECSLGGSAFAPCSSPQQYSGLANSGYTFLVRARDKNNKAGAAARFTWTVVNAAPIADSQTVITNVNRAVAIKLMASDSDPLTYQVIGAPAHGVLLGLAPNLTYVPDSGFSGTDSFTFRASDGQAVSNLATVTIIMDSTPPTVTCSVSPNRFWPPNHQLITVQATVIVVDTLSGPAGFTLVSVTSNEPDSGLESNVSHAHTSDLTPERWAHPCRTRQLATAVPALGLALARRARE